MRLATQRHNFRHLIKYIFLCYSAFILLSVILLAVIMLSVRLLNVILPSFRVLNITLRSVIL
jgi:hypothetical protein